MRGRKARLGRNLWERLWFEARRKIARERHGTQSLRLPTSVSP